MPDMIHATRLPEKHTSPETLTRIFEFDGIPTIEHVYTMLPAVQLPGITWQFLAMLPQAEVTLSANDSYDRLVQIVYGSGLIISHGPIAQPTNVTPFLCPHVITVPALQAVTIAATNHTAIVIVRATNNLHMTKPPRIADLGVGPYDDFGE